MKLVLYRIAYGKDSTLGVLFVKKPDGDSIGRYTKEFLCFTLEDEYRAEKVMAETRIPAGIYDICLRTEGGHHAKYSKRFADIHRGMLELQEVPNFTHILVHCGNTEQDTAGCLLLGYDPKRLKGGEYAVYSSTRAYFDVYPPIAKEIDEGRLVEIEIIDFDEGYKHLG